MPSPVRPPGRPPKYQIHLESETGQIHVLLINKEQNSDPVVVEVPPPPEIAAALKREEGGDILSLAQTLQSGVKREREPEGVMEAGPAKRARYGAGMLPEIETELCVAGTRESPSRAVRDTRAAVRGTVSSLTIRCINFNRPRSSSTFLPTLVRVTRTLVKTSTSPTYRQKYQAWRTSSRQKCSSDSVLRPQRRTTAIIWTTVKEFVICSMFYNLFGLQYLISVSASFTLVCFLYQINSQLLPFEIVPGSGDWTTYFTLVQLH